MLTLSKRLELISRSVPNGSMVADIGTDHGYLAIYLKKSGIAKNVIACDINQAPLKSAAKNASKYNTDIELCLCDGLDGVDQTRADVIIAAGMGAEVICGIIHRAPWLKNSTKKLILQPMNSPEFLRKYLSQNGFSITAEQAVYDSGRIYTVICAQYTGKIISDTNFYYTGLLSPKNKTDRKFLLKQHKRLKAWLDDIKNIESKHIEYITLKGVVEHLETFLEEP